MKVFKSQLFKWYPSDLIVSLLGLGYTNWCREAWLAIFTSIAVLLCGYFFTPLVSSHPTIMEYGIALARTAMVIFLVGWFSLMVFEAQNSGAEERIIIDYFWGLFFTLTLVLPSLSYASKLFDAILNSLCGIFIECFDRTHYISYVFAFAIPCTIYPYVGKWQFWPIEAIKRDIRSSLGNFLVELVKVIYTVLIFTIIAFFINPEGFPIIIKYWGAIFSNLIPHSWL